MKLDDDNKKSFQTGLKFDLKALKKMKIMQKFCTIGVDASGGESRDDEGGRNLDQNEILSSQKNET